MKDIFDEVSEFSREVVSLTNVSKFVSHIWIVCLGLKIEWTIKSSLIKKRISLDVRTIFITDTFAANLLLITRLMKTPLKNNKKASERLSLWHWVAHKLQQRKFTQIRFGAFKVESYFFRFQLIMRSLDWNACPFPRTAIHVTTLIVTTFHSQKRQLLPFLDAKEKNVS